MNEPRVEGEAAETSDVDTHLDAAIRELDRMGRAGAAPAATVAPIREDQATSIHSGVAELDSELFDRDLFEEHPVVASPPLPASGAHDRADPVPVVSPVTQVLHDAELTIGPEVTTTVEEAAAPAQVQESASKPHAAIVDASGPAGGATVPPDMTIETDRTETVPRSADLPAPATEAPEGAAAVAPSAEAAATEPAESPPVDPQLPVTSSLGQTGEQVETAASAQRMFGLRRALDAHRQGVRPAEIVTAAETIAVPETSAPSTAPPNSSSDTVAGPVEPSAESLPMPESVPQSPSEATNERRGWFAIPSAVAPIAVAGAVVATAATSAEPASPAGVQPGNAKPVTVPAVVTAPEVKAPDVAAPEPPPKAERRGWFGFRRVRDPEPVVPPPEPLVDLTPVREAMQAAAEGRAQEMQAAATVAVATRESGPVVTTTMPPASAAGRVGVLLINLGTPEAPTARAVRNYLREFLADKRVIEKDSFAWQIVLRWVILPWRPRFKARSYRAIWNKATNESPLKTITRAQATKLGEALAGVDGTIVVDWSMRYGQPSIEHRIKAMMSQGCERILVLPLYPQYSSATTATACDEVFRVLSRIRNQPAIRIAPAYYADPVYIEALASSIKAEIATLPFLPEVVVASFHGMPVEYVQKGDPYYQQCLATSKLLRERLGMNEQNFILTFQSRFGRTEWLQPYTIETLRKLAKDGVKNIAVVTPGFSADCLETLEEIAIENAHAFKKKGGKNFAYIPCLNDTERGMTVIWDIAIRELKGWM